MWAIVGEWTPAPTDCAKYLNGRGAGARYDGSLGGSTFVGDCSTKTGSGASFNSAYKTFLRQYWEAQVRCNPEDFSCVVSADDLNYR